MSFIRCTSNPEGLYIFETTIRSKSYAQVYAFAPRDRMMLIPWTVFRRACELSEKKAVAYYGPDVVVRGLRIRRIHAVPTTGKIVRVPKAFFARDPGETQVEVSYKGKRFWCWVVTWQYIVHNVLAEEPTWPRRRKR